MHSMACVMTTLLLRPLTPLRSVVVVSVRAAHNSSRPVKRKTPLSEKRLAHRFVDYKQMGVTAGSGGDGCMSFLSVLRNEWAGPDGGDGGNGGHVIFEASERCSSLSHLESLYRADSGVKGRNKHCTGANADHLVVPVPLGTFFKNTGNTVLADLRGEGERYIAARGGSGGHGNNFYLSNEQRAPTMFETGGKGDQLTLYAEMRVIANVGLIGFPNAGKSTLLGAISRAKPKVAAYPFTTLNPHVGIVNFGSTTARGEQQLSVADIPGLIVGASQNRGLGISFLRHIERCEVLAFVLDLEDNDLDPVQQLVALRHELSAYDLSLTSRFHVVVANKADVEPLETTLKRLRDLKSFCGEETRVFAISARDKENLVPLLAYLKQTVERMKNE